MPNTLPASLRKLMLIACAALLASCSATPPISPPPSVLRNEIPPLPAAARQPKSESPSWSARLTTLRQTLQLQQTAPASPASSASAATTR